MNLLYHFLIPSLWAAWAVYWLLLAKGVQKTTKAEPKIGRFIHLALVACALTLMVAPIFSVRMLGYPLLPRTPTVFFAGVAIVGAGLGFAVWARLHLGRYWSGTITLKEGHRLIRTGPYAFVRHPIYTGILLGSLGTGVSLGETRGAVAVLSLTAVYLIKIRREEHWLLREFGEEYAAYRREVPALVPFVI